MASTYEFWRDTSIQSITFVWFLWVMDMLFIFLMALIYTCHLVGVKGIWQNGLMYGRESKHNKKRIQFCITQHNGVWGEGRLTRPLCKLICSKMSVSFLAFLAFNLHEHLGSQTDRRLWGELNNRSSEKSISQYVCKNTSISRRIIKSHKEGSDNTVETLTYWSKETLIHTP